MTTNKEIKQIKFLLQLKYGPCTISTFNDPMSSNLNLRFNDFKSNTVYIQFDSDRKILIYTKVIVLDDILILARSETDRITMWRDALNNPIERLVS